MKKNLLKIIILTLAFSINAGEKIVIFDIDDVLIQRNSHQSYWNNSGLFASLAWNAPLAFASAVRYGLFNGAEMQKLVGPFAQKNPDVGIIEGLATTNTPVGKFLSTQIPSYNKTVAQILIDDFIANGTMIEESQQLAHDLKNDGFKIAYATNMSDKAFAKIAEKNLLPESNPLVVATSTGIKKSTEKEFKLFGSILKKSYDFLDADNEKFKKLKDDVLQKALEKNKKSKELDEKAEYFEKLGHVIKEAENGKQIDVILFIDNKKANLVDNKKATFAHAVSINPEKVHFIHYTLDQKAAGVRQALEELKLFPEPTHSK